MGVADVDATHRSGCESFDMLFVLDEVVHVHGAVEDDEDLRAVVDVPRVGLVGPVEFRGRLVELAEVESASRAVGSEGAGVDESHAMFRFAWTSTVFPTVVPARSAVSTFGASWIGTWSLTRT